MSEPTGRELSGRLAELEEQLKIMTATSVTEERIAEGVEALHAEAGAIKQVLGAVDAQQRRLLAVEFRTERVEQAARTLDDRRRTAMRLVAAGLLVATALVSFLTYLSLLSHVNELLDRQNAQATETCVVRNEGVRVQIRRERVLAEVANPEAREAHLRSADELEGLLLDCETFTRRGING